MGDLYNIVELIPIKLEPFELSVSLYVILTTQGVFLRCLSPQQPSLTCPTSKTFFSDHAQNVSTVKIKKILYVHRTLFMSTKC